MIKLKYILIVLGLACANVGLSQNLEAYLQEAAANNPEVKSAFYQFEAAMYKIERSNKLADPNLAIGYFISPIETRSGPQSATISLSQMFPWFGTLDLKQSQSKKNAEAKYNEFLAAKQEVYRDVKTVWYKLQTIETQIDLHRQNLEILKVYRKLSEAKYRSGKGQLSDVLRVDLLINTAQVDIELVGLDREPYQVQFNNLLNRPMKAIISLDSSHLVPMRFVSVSDSMLVATNPQLQALERQIEASLIGIDLLEKRGMPQFGLGLNYILVAENKNAGNLSGRDAILPTLKLSLPINRAKYRSWSKEVTSQNSALVYQNQAVQSKLSTKYQISFSEMEKQREKYLLYQKQIDNSIRIRTLLEKSYRHSGNEFEEVLLIQQKVLNYELMKINARMSYQVALATIDYLNAKEDYEINK
jgi:outer membrane protein, heavy metal efflux system